MKLKEALEQQAKSEYGTNKIFFKYDQSKYTIETIDEGLTIVCKSGPNVYLNTSMNISKCTDKYLTVYSYNMMSQKSSFKFRIDQMDFLGNGDITQGWSSI